MKIIFALLLTSILSAQQTGTSTSEYRPPQPPTPIAEIDALKLENAALRLELLSKEAEAIQAQRNQVIKGVCAAAKIDISECSIDLAKKTVSRSKLK